MPHDTTDPYPAVPERHPTYSGHHHQAPPARQSRRLRDHIIVLAVAVLAPALGGGLAATWAAVDSYRAAAKGSLRDTAQALALALDSEIDSVTTALVTLAESPDLRQGGDLAAFEVQARAVGRALGTAVLARGPAPDFPTVINTFVSPGGSIPRTPPEAQETLRNVVAAGRPRTTNLYLSRTAGHLMAAVVMPLAPDGPVPLLTMTLPPQRLSRLLQAQRLEGGGVASLADGGGRIVARSHDHDRYLGQPAPYLVGGRVNTVAVGLVRGVNLDGEDTLFAPASLELAPGWTVAVSMPWQVYEAAWQRPLLWFCASIAAVLVLGLGAAFLLARRVVRPIDALVGRAQAVASGTPLTGGTNDAEAPVAIAEIAELRAWMVAAEEALLRRGDALAEQNRTLADLAGTLDLGMAMVRDWDGPVRFWSKGCERLFGWSAEEAVGRDAHALLRTVFPIPLLNIEAALERDGEWTGDLRHHTRDGREVVVAVQKALRRDHAGRPVAVLESVADVTSARQAEAALQDSEAKLRSVVNTAADGILVADAAGRIVSANASAIRMFGHNAEEDLLGRDLNVLLPQVDPISSNRSDEKSGSVHIPARELTGVRRDGSEFPVELSTSLFASGNQRFSTSVVRDVTERRRAEELRSLLMREVDHRAKNVLAVTLSLLRLTPRNDAARFAASVEGRITSMARAHSLLAKQKWEGADLRALVEAELAAHAEHLSLSGPTVRLSSEAVQPMSMVLHELATNAAKYGAFSRPTGQVALSWAIVEDTGGLRLVWEERRGPTVAAPARRGFGSRLLTSLVLQQLGGTIELAWAKTGLHCAMRIAPRFLTIVEQPSALESPPPISGGNRQIVGAQQAASISHQPARGGARPRILVVEDEALLTLEIEAVLNELGCDVVGPARTLADAVRMAAGERPLRAAVLDVNLGGGDYSFPAVDLLETRGVPYIFTTGYGSADSLEGREHGAVAVLVKPYSREALANAIRAALQRDAHSQMPGPRRGSDRILR